MASGVYMRPLGTAGRGGNELRDSTLLDRYRMANDAAAFEELTRRYRGLVFATAYRVTSDRHDAEDVAQSCFLELARRPDSVTSSVAAYLHAAATHRARNAIRARVRRRKHERDAAADRSAVAPQHVAEELGWEELAPEVDAAVEELPEELRVPVILYYLRGLSDGDVAHELRLTRATVARRLKVGVRRLRASLSKGGISLSIGAIAIGLRASAAQAVPSSLTATLGRMALIGRAPSAAPTVSTLGSVGSVLRLVADRPGLASVAFSLVILTALIGYVFVSVWMPSSQPKPYDRLYEVYRPYMADTFPLRVEAISQDESAFWRGSQPLFFDWCKINAADWLADSDAYVLSYASPYLPDARTLPRKIDVANSARLPFQIELLQALVALRLHESLVSNPSRLDVDRKVVETYRQSLERSVGERSIARQPVASPIDEIARFVDANGSLRPVVHSMAGKVDEIVRPITDLKAVAAAVGEALRNNPRLLGVSEDRDEAWARTHIVAAGRRIRADSVASQGLLSLLVLIHPSPSSDLTDAVLLELREITPAAAELTLAISLDPRPPARRAAEDGERIARGGLPLSWCGLDGRSMLARVHEAPIDRDAMVGGASLAQDWATVTAATHRDAVNREHILAALTPEFVIKLSERADACAGRFLKDFEALKSDQRAQSDYQAADSQMAAWLNEGHRAMGKHNRKGK